MPTNKPKRRTQSARDGARQPQRAPRTASRSAREGYTAGQPSRRMPDRMRRIRQTATRWRMYGVIACAFVMAAGCLVGLLFFARPSVSEAENRTLTPFPAITVESFLDGSFFTDVSLWYADTYPLREPMVSANKALQARYGVSVNRGMVGGNTQADEIPVAEEAETQGDDEMAVPSVAKPDGQSEPPSERMIAEAVQNSIMDGLYIKDGAAYSIYYFSQTGADTYISAVNEAADQLDGTAHVYSLLVPSSAVALSDDEYDSVGGSDQRQVFDYVWTRLDDRATHVDLLEAMKAHRDDYPFFRTDHHWTQRGAYFGYVEYCKARGIEPASLDDFAYHDYGEFTGTYYENIAQLMTPNPDEFETYTPADTNEMTSWGTDESDETKDPIVADSSDWDTSSKYDGFSGSDPARGYIHNAKIGDGSSCLVVKDSYGSAFIPFLVASYEHVHIIDPRYYDGNVVAFAKDNDVRDVIFVYGIKVGLADKYAELLYTSIVGE